MAQFGRPDSTITQSTFTGGFAAIDEASPSDTDFAWGADNTADVLEVSLSDVTDPVSSSGHVFRYRVAKTNNGTVDGSGNAVTVTVELYQGTSQIATDTAKTANGTWTQYAYTLSGAEADAITDYTDLRLRFTTSKSGGSPANRRGGAVSWAELEVPDAPSSDRAARIAGFEQEVPTAPRQARIAGYEFEVPTAPRTARIAAVEIEVPTAPRTARIAAVEIEVPNAPRAARLSGFEQEVPTAPSTDRRAQLSGFEQEVPTAPRSARIAAVEFEVPAASNRTARIAGYEFEVPAAPRTARIAAVEIEVPTAPRTARIAGFELELADAPRRARLAGFELETPPSGNRTARISAYQFDVPSLGAVETAYVSGFSIGIQIGL